MRQLPSPATTEPIGPMAIEQVVSVLISMNWVFGLNAVVIVLDPADTMTTAGLNAAYANAPNNSLYITGDGATTKKIAIKFGTPGLTNGSFLFSAALAAV